MRKATEDTVDLHFALSRSIWTKLHTETYIARIPPCSHLPLTLLKSLPAVAIIYLELRLAGRASDPRLVREVPAHMHCAISPEWSPDPTAAHWPSSMQPLQLRLEQHS